MCVIFGISVVVLYTELAWLTMKISFVNLGKQKTEDGRRNCRKDQFRS